MLFTKGTHSEKWLEYAGSPFAGEAGFDVTKIGARVGAEPDKAFPGGISPLH